MAASKAVWYSIDPFVAKLDEEIYRAVRYGVPFSIVVVMLPFVNQNLCYTVERFMVRGLRQIDFVMKAAEDKYALALPSTGKEGAEVVANRLRQQFAGITGIGSRGPLVGTAAAPEDGDQPNALLNIAYNRALELQAAAQQAEVLARRRYLGARTVGA
jgi:GGDEF domain-containing protein